MDEPALHIRELIVSTCVASQPEADLLHVRADLLVLAEDTGDGEAADDAWGAVAEIDVAVAAPAVRAPHRWAS